MAPGRGLRQLRRGIFAPGAFFAVAPVALIGDAADAPLAPANRYGQACAEDTQCRSGLCGVRCDADGGAGCVCPTAGNEERCSRSHDVTVQCNAVCCATVGREDADHRGRFCVVDRSDVSASRNARAQVRRTVGGGAAVLQPVPRPRPGATAPAMGSRAFGETCESWSECASGVCASGCRCDEASVKEPQTCACESLQSSQLQARRPRCGAFFVGDDACGGFCPPCSEEQCRSLPATCRWGCTEGASRGRCSASPPFFLNDRACAKCCNANFCRKEGGLRGDWIAEISGPLPGMDEFGHDLWAAEMTPCPKGQAWVGSACIYICEQPRHTVLDRILDLGNSSWTLDGRMNVLLTRGATIIVSCQRGFAGTRRSWNVTCTGRSWMGDALPDCRELRCDAPYEPVGVWGGDTGFNKTLRLRCNEGYVPSKGAVELVCNGSSPAMRSALLHASSGGPLPALAVAIPAWPGQPVARCVPGGGSGDAGSWREGLRMSAMWSCASVVALAFVVVVACARDPAPVAADRRRRSLAGSAAAFAESGMEGGLQRSSG